MTIEEAIEKEKSIAKSNHELANSYHTDFNVYMRQEGACRERAEYHEQVAEWLEELQRLKEQEPCVDCISRQAVLDMQYRIDDSLTLSTRDVVNVDDVEDLPPVTPQPKMGRWMKVYAESEGSSSWIEFKCPHCGNEFGIESGQYGWYYTDPIPWIACPMCGGSAKM